MKLCYDLSLSSNDCGNYLIKYWWPTTFYFVENDKTCNWARNCFYALIMIRNFSNKWIRSRNISNFVADCATDNFLYACFSMRNISFYIVWLTLHRLLRTCDLPSRLGLWITQWFSARFEYYHVSYHQKICITIRISKHVTLTQIQRYKF